MNNNKTTTETLLSELHECELLLTRLKRQLQKEKDNTWQVCKLSLLLGTITGLVIGYTIF